MRNVDARQEMMTSVNCLHVATPQRSQGLRSHIGTHADLGGSKALTGPLSLINLSLS